MFRRCCVPSCASERKDVKLHKIPVSHKKAAIWLDVISAAVPSARSLKDLTWSVKNKLHVCHKHFEKKHVRPSMRLKPNACPTLFSSSEVNSGKPVKSYGAKEAMERELCRNIDHPYSRKRQYDHTYAKNPNSAENIDTAEITGCVPVPVPLPEMYAMPGPSAGQSAAFPDLAVSTTMPDNSIVTPSTSQGAVEQTDQDLLDLPSIQRSGRKKLVPAVETLSPKCRELYKHYKKAKKQLSYQRRAKMALKFSKQDSLKNLVVGMNPVARNFLWMQIKLCTTKRKARRFTLEEKIIALSIMKQSPKCYRFLQRIFILPCKTTLNKMLAELNIEAGISPQIVNVLKQEVSGWDDSKKLCCVIFDEMKLEPGLHYSKKKDNINGFVELSQKTHRLADHALTFIVKGAVHQWQQPMAFYFSEGAASGAEMKVIIKKVVEAVCETGLQPIALISDQGTSFQFALRSLQEDTRRLQILAGVVTDDTIHLNGQCLSVIYDPPHLIKGVRNNFLTKNIVINGKTCKWQDLVDVYRTDCSHAQARLLHKLSDEYILPEKIKKMKVRNCVSVLSKTMAAALHYTASFSHYADGTPVSDTLSNTAELVEFLDDLFDSVNGASTHHKHTKGKRTSSVPSLKNWIITIKSFQRLWQVLNSKNINIMRPRYFNSDAIENFFGRVRSYNARNNNPTCHAFACTFKSLLVTNFIKFHEKSYNCEDDCTEQIIKIQQLFNKDTDVTDQHTADGTEPAPSTSSTSVERDGGAEQMRLQAIGERLNVHSRAYTAGWVVRKVLKAINCAECKKDFTTNQLNVHKWITHRERRIMEANKLTYPAVLAVRAFGDIMKEANDFLEKKSHEDSILQQIILNLLSKYKKSFDFINCNAHKDAAKHYFTKISVTLCIFNWCNTINKILKGTDVSRLNNTHLPVMQSQALIKYKKSLKNKSLNKYLVVLLHKLFYFTSNVIMLGKAIISVHQKT